MNEFASSLNVSAALVGFSFMDKKKFSIDYLDNEP